MELLSTHKLLSDIEADIHDFYNARNAGKDITVNRTALSILHRAATILKYTGTPDEQVAASLVLHATSQVFPQGEER